MSKMLETARLGTQWWNDSCHIGQLGEAIENGASGATSNPVIVFSAVNDDKERWLPVLDRLIVDHPHDTEDEIAWRLIEEVGVEASKLLLPHWEKTQGQQGYLSIQVSPKLWRNAEAMVLHGKQLASLAPNIAIKAPSTQAGYDCFLKLTEAGINVNCTVSFSLSQVIMSAEIIEKGLQLAKNNGINTDKMNPYITIMVGRVDDQVSRQIANEAIVIDPGYTQWAGIAVFKRAWKRFQQRGYASKLLAAAYRNPMQWSRLQGEGVLQTIPYSYWKQFDGCDIEVKESIDDPVDERIVRELRQKCSDFRMAYDDDTMNAAQFEKYGASVHTLKQFLSGYGSLLELVRERMITQ